MHWIFWSSLLLLVYIYVGYPALAALLAASTRRPDRRTRELSSHAHVPFRHPRARLHTPHAPLRASHASLRPSRIPFRHSRLPFRHSREGGNPEHLTSSPSLCTSEHAPDKTAFPKVSLLIPAYNEAEAIEETLRNKLALDYPPELLEIRVVSDDSDDGTDEIVERVAAQSVVAVHLYRQSPRRGKTTGINTLVEHADGEILAFADANSLWDQQALMALVRNFADAEVGYVTGKMVYTHPDGALIGDGCSAYMRYENWLRRKETAMGSVVGVDGGIDAMRRSLYAPLRSDQLPDFVQPLKVVEQGYRVIYEPAAVLKEPTLQDSGSEFSMRVRVTLRALWALWDMGHLMNPARDPYFAFQLISHKLLRYLAFIPLVSLALSNLFLLGSGLIYVLSGIGQVTFYALAYLRHRRAQQLHAPVWQSVPYYFALLNLACARAVFAFCRGERKAIWTPRKG